MLNERFWRYSTDEGTLWRRAIDSAYGGNDQDLVPAVFHFRRFSGIWKKIMKSSLSSDEMFDFFMSGIGYLLGDEKKFYFGLMNGYLGSF
ncbi:hypothetical protein PTKIN_Ptkin14bG0089100 [Pterospermum kingtungense]